MNQFHAVIEIIGINPFVFLPDGILQKIFESAGKDRGHIPVKGTINGKEYKQTLVKYSGAWGLYINTTMLKNSPKHIGDTIDLTIVFDPVSREIVPPAAFLSALKNDGAAKDVFDALSASKKHEIVRYLAHLKSTAALDKNILRAIRFLHGKERFVGREKP